MQPGFGGPHQREPLWSCVTWSSLSGRARTSMSWPVFPLGSGAGSLLIEVFIRNYSRTFPLKLCLRK